MTAPRPEDKYERVAHRNAVLEEAAALATNYGGGESYWAAGKGIADAIRALKNNADRSGVRGSGDEVKDSRAAPQPEAGKDTDTPEELRMVIGYLAGELQIAGDHRSTPEIVFNAVSAIKRSSTPKDLAKGTSHMTDDPQRSSRNSSGNPIRTWHERCEAHPDHEGIVTNAMVQARMQEEIDELRAAVSERPLRQVGQVMYDMAKDVRSVLDAIEEDEAPAEGPPARAEDQDFSIFAEALALTEQAVSPAEGPTPVGDAFNFWWAGIEERDGWPESVRQLAWSAWKASAARDGAVSAKTLTLPNDALALLREVRPMVAGYVRASHLVTDGLGDIVDGVPTGSREPNEYDALLKRFDACLAGSPVSTTPLFNPFGSAIQCKAPSQNMSIGGYAGWQCHSCGANRDNPSCRYVQSASGTITKENP